MIALVTGSTGFCGSRLVAALRANGHTVARVSTKASAADVDVIDLTDVPSIVAVLARVRPTVIFHLHGATAGASCSTLVRNNVLVAASLLDAVPLAGIPEPTVVVAGSAAEYGALDSTALPATEDTPLNPVTPYGISKRAQSDIALAAGRLGRRVVVARPSNVIGPGMPRHLALANFANQLASIEAARATPVLSVGQLESVRDFIDVDDVVRDLVELACHPGAVGRVFNVSSGRGVRLRDALDAMIREFGLSVDVRVEPSIHRANEVLEFRASRERIDRLLEPRALIPFDATVRRVVSDARRRALEESPRAT